jgi:hypothetical protein
MMVYAGCDLYFPSHRGCHDKKQDRGVYRVATVKGQVTGLVFITTFKIC